MAGVLIAKSLGEVLKTDEPGQIPGLIGPVNEAVVPLMAYHAARGKP